MHIKLKCVLYEIFLLQIIRQRIPKGKSKMDSPEKLATYGTQDEEKQNKNITQYVLTP